MGGQKPTRGTNPGRRAADHGGLEGVQHLAVAKLRERGDGEPSARDEPVHGLAHEKRVDPVVRVLVQAGGHRESRLEEFLERERAFHVEGGVADGLDGPEHVPNERLPKRLARDARVVRQVRQRVAQALAEPEVARLPRDRDHPLRVDFEQGEGLLNGGILAHEPLSRLLVVRKAVPPEDRLDRVRERGMPDVMEKRRGGRVQGVVERDVVQGGTGDGRGAHPLGVHAPRERLELGGPGFLSVAERDHRRGNPLRPALQPELADPVEPGKRGRGTQRVQRGGMLGKEPLQIPDRRRRRGNDAERIPLDREFGNVRMCHLVDLRLTLPAPVAAVKRTVWITRRIKNPLDQRKERMAATAQQRRSATTIDVTAIVP